MIEPTTLASILLTRDELYALTRRVQPAAQVRWLTHAGWKFARDSDGYPIVAREEFLRHMIGAHPSEAPAKTDDASFEVNVTALRRLRGEA
jgi:Domain of unknown function (DUF4224)